MIFKKLEINNFGIYKGKHLINLDVEDGKPIILIGALNGGGKTTFLDAIQLVLYGKHARCSNRAGTAYTSFLANSKNRFSSPDSLVKLKLTFTHQVENQTSYYEIERTWQTTDSNTKEKIKVLVDNQPDEHLSVHWDEFVSEFIPLSLSDLFFFDGEKIENLAHPQRSSELVKTGIESLLGLDLLSQLQIDLTHVRKRRLAQNVDNSVVEKIKTCESEIEDSNLKIFELKRELIDIEQRKYESEIAVSKARQLMRTSGAHLLEKRDEIKYELGRIETKLENNKLERIKLASGVGPLGLVKELIEETKNQINLENEAYNSKILNESIRLNNHKLLSALKDAGLTSTIISHVETIMELQNDELKSSAETKIFLNKNINIFNELNDKILFEEKQYILLKKENLNLIEKKEILQKQLNSVPDYESVKHLVNNLAEHELVLRNLDSLIMSKKKHLEEITIKNGNLLQRYTNYLAQQNRETFEQKHEVQVSEHIQKIRENLAKFSDQLIKENIETLQQLVKEKFDTLGRKSQLITKLDISPHDFTIKLYDASGNLIEPARLSAGERQLLAISILWGLAEASGKELPTIIDTPLSRLDGKHRNKLIKNYFPNAGPQVILLSTDEEIIDDYYNQLKPYISREFNISYNDEDKTSNIKEGYF